MGIYDNYSCDGQLNIFDYVRKPFKIDKPIRLIELFGGLSSQAMALKRLCANFEHYRLVEFDPNPVKTGNAIHGTNFEPMDITKINGDDLGIVDTENYCYILTYSFPCQDLSIAGKMKGMSKYSGTRSGLLWEVERLLNECKELPQVLLMENVPQVHSEQNMPDFQMWLKFLESKGYCNYWQDLNARDYGVPQNRRRCFCVSLLGEYNYKFPAPIPLKVYADELLEPIVSDKYKIGGKRAKELLDKLIMDEEALSRAEQSRAEQIGYIPGSLTYTKRVHPISESLIALQQGKEEYQTTCKSQKEHCEVIAFCDQRYDEGLRVRNEMICPCITLHSASQTFNTSCPYVLERHEKDIH